MAAEMIDVHGKIMFIHAVGFNKFDKWSITIAPDNKSLEIIRDLQAQGVKNVMKKDEENGYYIQFSREPTKLMRGKVVAFTAPKVIGADGLPIDGTRVGRGSDATVRLEVYQHGTPSGGKAKAARWDSVRVDTLVPYDPDKSLTADEAANMKDLAVAPAQEPW